MEKKMTSVAGKLVPKSNRTVKLSSSTSEGGENTVKTSDLSEKQLKHEENEKRKVKKKFVKKKGDTRKRNLSDEATAVSTSRSIGIRKTAKVFQESREEKNNSVENVATVFEKMALNDKPSEKNIEKMSDPKNCGTDNRIELKEKLATAEKKGNNNEVDKGSGEKSAASVTKVVKFNEDQESEIGQAGELKTQNQRSVNYNTSGKKSHSNTEEEKKRKLRQAERFTKAVAKFSAKFMKAAIEMGLKPVDSFCNSSSSSSSDSSFLSSDCSCSSTCTCSECCTTTDSSICSCSDCCQKTNEKCSTCDSSNLDTTNDTTSTDSSSTSSSSIDHTSFDEKSTMTL